MENVTSIYNSTKIPRETRCFGLNMDSVKGWELRMAAWGEGTI